MRINSIHPLVLFRFNEKHKKFGLSLANETYIFKFGLLPISQGYYFIYFFFSVKEERHFVFVKCHFCIISINSHFSLSYYDDGTTSTQTNTLNITTYRITRQKCISMWLLTHTFSTYSCGFALRTHTHTHNTD